MRILCFGDSNTYGYDPRGFGGDRYPAHSRWPDLLAQKTGFTIINAGMNGQDIPSDDSIHRLLSRHNPVDSILIMLGTNNLLQGDTAPETARKMENFLSSLLPCRNPILLVAPPPLKRGAWVDSDRLVDESRLLAEEYRLVSQRLEIPFLNTGSWEIPMAFDGVHLTEEGHRVFAENMYRSLP